MGSIVGGLFGGGKGLGFEAKSANILNPTTVDQADAQYGNVQGGLLNQSNFLNAVQAQHGLQNQSNVYNQMQGVANGTGPNPAQAALNQATQANVANQAALMAGQRGSSANPALAARQAAMQGANIQQQAAGQGATMQANQSLNALNQMGGLATNQANQQANATNAYTNSALAGQQNILGGIAGQNNANVGMQSNINSADAGIAGAAAGQQGNMMGGMMQGIGAAASMFGGGKGGGSPTGDGGIGTSGTAVGGGFGDAGSAIGDGATMVAAKGGMVPQKFADGGTPMIQAQIPQQNFMQQQANLQPQATPVVINQASKGGGGMDPMSMMGGMMPSMGGGGNTKIVDTPAVGSKPGPVSEAGKQEVEGNPQAAGLLGTAGSVLGGIFGGIYGGPAGSMAGSAVGKAGGSWLGNMLADGGQVQNGPVSHIGRYFANGGRVPALVSPGETYLDPREVSKVAKGANPLQVGEKIPGKPKVKGNDYQNDTVHKTLESGGIVIPNSIMQSKDAEAKAAKFVSAILRKQSLKKG